MCGLGLVVSVSYRKTVVRVCVVSFHVTFMHEVHWSDKRAQITRTPAASCYTCCTHSPVPLQSDAPQSVAALAYPANARPRPPRCPPPPTAPPRSSRRRRGHIRLVAASTETCAPGKLPAAGRDGKSMDLFEHPQERLRLRSHERARKRRRELSCEREGMSLHSRGWRVFAEQRKLTAERVLAAVPAIEARERRHDWLPPPHAPGRVVAIACGCPVTCCMDVLRGGERIVTTDFSGTLRVMAVEDGALLWEVSAHTECVNGSDSTELTVLSDRVVATGASDGFLRVWNADTGEKLCQIKVDRVVFTLAAISTRQFIAGFEGGDIIVYEYKLGTGLAEAFRLVDANPRSGFDQSTDCRNWDDNINVISFALCGERLASLSANGNVTIWDLKARSRLALIHGRGAGWVRCLDMNESLIVVGYYDAPHVRVYSAADNYSCIGATGAFDWVHNNLVSSVRILGSGHVMSASVDQTIAISSLQSNKVVARMKLDFDPWVDFCVLPDGSIAVAAAADEGRKVAIGQGAATIIFHALPAAARLLKTFGDSNRLARLS